ncbi:hypothetical protein A1F97_08102 [Pyrenophora tritici-repentis]|nr:hypothetical protein PtrEW4_009618 [Pyrenophora tritici-repentis]KAI1566140.1 hypothetical protein PtrEW7m1_009650 [Pyrenophora tritici-repentis]KAI1596467.1 hypothetical protein PtrCC142_009608 [Pyrenophora tritici-repentis]PWO21380.1 WD40 repeat containing protein [Pyrenophora tritici-repentis]PZC90125.1 hypothetical protein A1F95_09772 [Pyrenophora tritici-repentis]
MGSAIDNLMGDTDPEAPVSALLLEMKDRMLMDAVQVPNGDVSKTSEGDASNNFLIPTTTSSSKAKMATAATTTSKSHSDYSTASPSFTTIIPDPALITGGPSSGKRNNSGLSSGAVAGISIGTLIIGALLAFIAAFFLFKRQNRQARANVGGTGYTSYGESAPELVMMQQKSVGSLGGRNSPYVQVSQTPAPRVVPPPAPIPVQQTTPEDATAFLPPAAHDDEVHGRVSGLLDRIHEHVERFYRDVHASITPSMEHEIAKFGSKDVEMAELLQNCSNPTTALKHALVAYVLGITAPKSNEGEQGTVFPEELSRIIIENSTETASNPSVIAAASLHRRISVYLYTAVSNSQDSRETRLTQSNIREAAEHFSLTFFPWANPASCDQDKDDDLGRIMTEALEISIWLLGQPGLYEFEWEGTVGGVDETRIVEGVVVAM